SRGWTSLLDPSASLLVLSLNELGHRSFIERESVVQTDFHLTADSQVALPRLVELMRSRETGPEERRRWVESVSADTRARKKEVEVNADHLTESHAISAVHAALGDIPWQLAFPGFRDWVRRTWTL